MSSFETACGAIDAVDGRDGSWFVYATANSIASPGPKEPFRVSCEGADGSCYAACVSGMLAGNGVDSPTVGLGFTPRANGVAYDASRYHAIDFWMHAFVGPGSTLRLLVPLKADTMVGTGDDTCTTDCLDACSVMLPAAPPGGSIFPCPSARCAQQSSGCRRQAMGPDHRDVVSVGGHDEVSGRRRALHDLRRPGRTDPLRIRQVV